MGIHVHVYIHTPVSLYIACIGHTVEATNSIYPVEPRYLLIFLLDIAVLKQP